MSNIRIDPRAAAAIDERASLLISAIRQVSARQPTKPSWRPDIPIVAELTAANFVGEVDMGTTTPDGDYMSLEFRHAGNTYSLDGDAYRELRKLATDVMKAKPIGQMATVAWVETVLRRWTRDTFRGQCTASAAETLLAALTPEVATYTVWVPLEQLHIQVPIQLGHSGLQPISAEFLARIVAHMPPEARQPTAARIERYRGAAAIVVACDCSLAKAREIALSSAERALGALSLLSPGALRATAASGVCLWGSHRRQTASTFDLRDDGHYSRWEGATTPLPVSESLDERTILQFAPVLSSLHALLLADEDNALAEKILDALSVYRRAVISPDPAEKLIFIFVALEMLLVRDPHESLQDNVATRVAFLVGSDVAGRKDIIKAVKHAYKLRSQFIHHGISHVDPDTADPFLVIAWRTLLELVNAISRFSRKEDLISDLDDRRLQ